jgi:hypothetical protein
MEQNKTNTTEKIEKELKTLVSRMKNENTALSKILIQLESIDEKKTQKIKKKNNQ